MSSPNLKAQLFDLADQDREALALIREDLQLTSNALAVRIAIRSLAKKLAERPGEKFARQRERTEAPIDQGEA